MLYAFYQTRKGFGAIAGREKGVVSMLVLPAPDKESAFASLLAAGMPKEAVECFDAFENVTMQVESYFEGRRIDFSCEIDLKGYNGFRRDVWDVVRNIPYGEVRTYKWVANRLGRPSSARAVGRALAENPIPIIIPCHRVIRADGTLGGYRWGLGWKNFLLSTEIGVRIESLGNWKTSAEKNFV